ncbi:unnamed protein product [Bemisia tabaci]|uniref:Uncharacterized protein n=1 Tax=Bemisia tabaci TaxID=7038 RepID=A0A9P0A2Q2_BEMTA|nr:unnamed protein product [Bemisia tabaci]
MKGPHGKNAAPIDRRGGRRNGFPRNVRRALAPPRIAGSRYPTLSDVGTVGPVRRRNHEPAGRTGRYEVTVTRNRPTKRSEGHHAHPGSSGSKIQRGRDAGRPGAPADRNSRPRAERDGSGGGFSENGRGAPAPLPGRRIRNPTLSDVDTVGPVRRRNPEPGGRTGRYEVTVTRNRPTERSEGHRAPPIRKKTKRPEGQGADSRDATARGSATGKTRARPRDGRKTEAPPGPVETPLGVGTGKPAGRTETRPGGGSAERTPRARDALGRRGGDRCSGGRGVNRMTLYKKKI